MKMCTVPVCLHEPHVQGVVKCNEVVVGGDPPEREVQVLRRHLLVLAVTCKQ